MPDNEFRSHILLTRNSNLTAEKSAQWYLRICIFSKTTHKPVVVMWRCQQMCRCINVANFVLPNPSLTLSIIAVRRKSPSRRRRSRTLPLHRASRRSTPITTLWRRRPPLPPSQMVPPFSPPHLWPGNWHDHRPSVHPVHIMSCLSTSSPLSRRSTTNQMGWGMEVTGSATAVSSSRIWTCQCLWTFQTIANQTWPGRSPWGTCSHAAVASALMFSWTSLELDVSLYLNGFEGPRLDWAWARLCLCHLDQFSPV